MQSRLPTAALVPQRALCPPPTAPRCLRTAVTQHRWAFLASHLRQGWVLGIRSCRLLGCAPGVERVALPSRADLAFPRQVAEGSRHAPCLLMEF